MSPEGLAALAGASAAVVALAALAGPAPAVGRRVAALGPPREAATRTRPTDWAGRQLRGLLGRSSDPLADRTVGRVALAVVALVVVDVALSVLVAGVAGVVVVLRRRRRVRERRAALVEQLPEIVDLLTLSASAGLSIPMSIATVARHGVGEVAVALGRAHDLSSRGVALAEAVADIPRELGDEVRPLARVLSGALREGSSIVPSLERLAGEVRVERRRAAEERARRLPVVLLFPLVVCVLPAFGLLTVVPLLVGALGGLPR